MPDLRCRRAHEHLSTARSNRRQHAGVGGKYTVPGGTERGDVGRTRHRSGLAKAMPPDRPSDGAIAVASGWPIGAPDVDAAAVTAVAAVGPALGCT